MKDDANNIELTFMFCNWYSGGTLFSIILNSSSDITCNGEVFPWQGGGIKNDCSCGETVLNCQFYNYCASEMKKDNGSFDLDVFRVLPKLSGIKTVNRYLNSFLLFPRIKEYIIKKFPPWKSRLNFFICNHIKFFEKALKLEGKKIYIDGTKNIRRAELFVGADNVNIKVIHLIRDGRGFCNSWVKNRGCSKESGLEVAANDWNDYILQVDEFSNRYPEVPVLTVKYEDLCRDLEVQQSRIQDFMSLAGRWEKVGGNPFHILGNRMRRSFSGDIQEDLSWQSELSSEQVEQIESIMKKQLERYGYI